MRLDVAKILRSPSSGALLTFDGQGFTDPGGKRYRYENGIAFISDDADVSPFLMHDAPWFQLSHDRPDLKQNPEWEARQANYERARGINTDFLFSMLRYQGVEGRRVTEVGVGSCDIIRGFAKIGFQAIAVDFFPWDMQDAYGEAIQAGEPDFTCISAPMARLPFADGSIDLIYFHAAIHHALPRDHATFRWSDPNNLVDCLREVRRVLKPREQGGAFFLLGEGIYPEEFGPDDRYHERLCQSNQDMVYESWYKISEYESIYKHVGIFPNLFLWQEQFIVHALGYTPDGDKYNLVTPSDLISDDNYWRLSRHLSQGAELILPSWITVDDAPSPFRGAFPVNGDAIVSSVHTIIGLRSQIDNVPVFTAEINAAGFLLYGPYVPLEPGRYEVRFVIRREPGLTEAELVCDTLSSVGPLCEPKILLLTYLPSGQWQTIVLPIDVPAGADKIETRIFLPRPTQNEISVVAAVAFRKCIGVL